MRGWASASGLPRHNCPNYSPKTPTSSDFRKLATVNEHPHRRWYSTYIEKEAIQIAVQKLAERAEDCFDRAKLQHASADKQHASADAQHVSAPQHASAAKQQCNADKLVVLGVALEADAVELNGELQTSIAAAGSLARPAA
jgi:hypothetical protein